MRSYPTAHGGGLSAAAGWEHVLALDLAGHAPRVAEEAVALLSAPQCPAGTSTIVLHGEQVALQVHESIGHALELDRILLGEASYAGTSWVGPDDLGSLRYGSDLLHVTADATLPHGLGSFGWDDEGVAAVRADLVEGGVLRGALSNRESAAAVGLSASGGCARADGFARQPIVRMTNVSLEPGTVPTLADLVADTDEGLYLETNRSWSIDDRRLQFQFATELCREIRGGELGRLYRNGSYAGVTPRFWGSLDAICGPDEWRLWGLTNCGKGEPGPGHGRLPRRRPGALSRRAGRSGVTDLEPLELAERALGFADGEAQATVVRERSLLSRFAVSRPTQATEVDDLTVSMLCVEEGHTGSAETNATTDEALRDVAARARAAARAAAGAAGEPGDYPGLPAPAPAPRHDGFDRAHRAARPRRGGRGPERGLRALRGRRAAGVRDLDRGRGRHRHRLVAPACARWTA